MRNSDFFKKQVEKGGGGEEAGENGGRQNDKMALITGHL